MEVIRTMPATEKKVMNAELKKDFIKSDCLKPLIKFSAPTKVS